MQLRIFHFNDVLKKLKAGKDGLVPENYMGGTQLAVLVKEDLELRDSIKICFVN